jgi:transcription elongation factor Elf1
MSAPAKTDATTPCPHCAGTMTISMIGPIPAEPTFMNHTFACPACGHSATFKFKKKDAG